MERYTHNPKKREKERKAKVSFLGYVVYLNYRNDTYGYW